MSGRNKNFHRNAQPKFREKRIVTDWSESERLARRPAGVSVNPDAGCGRFFWNGKRLMLVIKESFLSFPREKAA